MYSLDEFLYEEELEALAAEGDKDAKNRLAILRDARKDKEDWERWLRGWKDE